MKPSLHLGRNWVNTYDIRNIKLLSGMEDSHHGPNDAMHNPPQPLKVILMVTATDSRQAKIHSHMLILDRHITSRKMPHSSFQVKDEVKYEHVSPKVKSTQDGKRSQDDDKRLCLVDDLKKLKITYKSSLKEQAQA
ncbi:hypothetical protein Tco_0110405 [Tanacetum coccineum]